MTRWRFATWRPTRTPTTTRLLRSDAADGTKIGANASKYRALSWAHANKIEAQLRQEVQTFAGAGREERPCGGT